MDQVLKKEAKVWLAARGFQLGWDKSNEMLMSTAARTDKEGYDKLASFDIKDWCEI